MKNKKILINITNFMLFAILIAVDQITKILSVQHLKNQEPIDIIDGVLQLTYVANPGAMWGIMPGKQLFFIIITSIMLLAIIFMYIITPIQKKYNPLKLILVVLECL